MKDNKEPIIIDYQDDLLHPHCPNSFKQDYEAMAKTYEKIREMSKAFNITVITAKAPK